MGETLPPRSSNNGVVHNPTRGARRRIRIDKVGHESKLAFTNILGRSRSHRPSCPKVPEVIISKGLDRACRDNCFSQHSLCVLSGNGLDEPSLAIPSKTHGRLRLVKRSLSYFPVDSSVPLCDGKTEDADSIYKTIRCLPDHPCNRECNHNHSDCQTLRLGPYHKCIWPGNCQQSEFLKRL